MPEKKRSDSLARNILAENLELLFTQSGCKSPRAWAVKMGMDHSKLRRAMQQINAPDLDTVQVFADAAGKQPYELLCPGMEPPIPNVSPKARHLARLFDEIAHRADRDRAFALAVHVLSGEIPDETALRVDEADGEA